MLILMLIFRLFNKISGNTLNIIYLIIFMIELVFCCGGFNGMPRRQIDTIQTIQDKLESRNDPILIKPLIIMAVPLIIVFLINYLY